MGVGEGAGVGVWSWGCVGGVGVQGRRAVVAGPGRGCVGECVWGAWVSGLGAVAGE